MDAAAGPRAPRVRAIYGASLAPDATAVAHLVDEAMRDGTKLKEAVRKALAQLPRGG